MMMKWTHFSSISNTATTSFTRLTFHHLFIVFISTISELLWIDRLSIRLLFILFFMLLFFLVNDSIRVLPSFPDRWLIRRGTPFPPPFGSSEAFAMATPPTYRATTPTSAALEHQKKCLNPLRRFQTRVPRHTIVRFSIQKCTDRWFSIRFVWDLY